MLRTTVPILAVTFFAVTSAVHEYCPDIHWSSESFDSCSSTIYSRTEITHPNEIVPISQNGDLPVGSYSRWIEHLCVHTEFQCTTVLDTSQLRHISCWNAQRSIWFEHYITGDRSIASSVNVSICQSKSTTAACAFRFIDNGTDEFWWNLLVETSSQQNSAFSWASCNCEFYSAYADSQWRTCTQGGSLIVLKILLVAGLVTLAIVGCIAYSFKFKKRPANSDNVQQS